MPGDTKPHTELVPQPPLLAMHGLTAMQFMPLLEVDAYPGKHVQFTELSPRKKHIELNPQPPFIALQPSEGAPSKRGASAYLIFFKALMYRHRI